MIEVVLVPVAALGLAVPMDAPQLFVFSLRLAVSIDIPVSVDMLLPSLIFVADLIAPVDALLTVLL